MTRDSSSSHATRRSRSRPEGCVAIPLATDLGLNPGNLHAFLAQGDPEGASLDKAVRLVKYLEAA